MILLELFWEFFKTGLFTVGGGMAALPLLTDMAKRRPWFDEAILGDMIAISESTPGPIGVNMATYAGFNAAGIPGAIVATLALALPSLIIVCLVAMALKKFKENELVQSAFFGLRPAVVGLIAAAGLDILRRSEWVSAAFRGAWMGLEWDLTLSIPAFALFALILFGLLKFKKIHPVIYIAVGAAAGMLLKIG